MNKKYHLGVIGAGNMGMAIANGIVNSGISAQKIILFNRSPEKREKHKNLNFSVSDNYVELYEQSEMVLIAVKPQNFSEVLENLSKSKANPLVISIAAGITFKTIETTLNKNCPIIRCMPNTPLMINKGATQLVKNSYATNKDLETVCKIFDNMGITTIFDDENKLNDVIPFAGSAPAYIYSFTEGMMISAKKYGIDENEALKLFCQALIGSAQMMLKGDKTPKELKESVCSPNGATIEAMKVFEENNLNKILDTANEKCILRAYELGNTKFCTHKN